MALTPQWIDELRSRVTLSTLIGRSIKVTRAGREYKACCPFHNEKTPSFTINDEKGFYHCFGCGAHGDAIRWMTDQRGLSFLDAIKELAATAGMDVPAPDPRAAKQQEEAKSLRDVTAAAAEWFTAQLDGVEGAGARSYLTKRGISDATRRAFGFGLAPDSRNKLKIALAEFPVPMLVEAGMLIAVDDKEPYDRFRGRLMIPIRDARGRVIAFGGRILGSGEPKYLNSPDTPLFDKGRILYNLDRASPASRKTNRVIVVEGYMDVVALAEAGVSDVVAPLGTALTDSQLTLLWRMVDAPVFCFDGDAAGYAASVKAAAKALENLAPGKTAKFVHLEAGKDPDDIVRNVGADAFNAIIDQAVPLSEFVYQSTLSKVTLSIPEGRASLLTGLGKLAAAIPDQVIAKEYGRWFRNRFYDDFGWSAKGRHQIYQGTIETSARQQPAVYNSYVRSACYGVSRFPAVAIRQLEQFASIKMPDALEFDSLKRWRDNLADYLFENPNCDDDAIKQIIYREEYAKELKFDLQRDLRFPWIEDDDLATNRLPQFIEFLAIENDITFELESLNLRLLNSFTEETYQAIEQRRSILRAERVKLFGTTLDWMDAVAA